MKPNERLKLIIAYLKANKFIQSQKELGFLLGFKTESAFSQVVNNKVPFSESLYSKINSLYSNINIEWLKNGDGEMLFQSESESKPIIKSNSKFTEQRYKKEVIIIPAKAGLSLMSNYYAEELLQEMEKRTIYLDKDAKGRYFEIEGEGDSMNDGTKDAILDGDKLLIREISKLYWKSPFHKNDWDFTFFHLEHGFLTKCIVEQNIETGDILLGSRNPDKEQYPNFWINLKDCAFVCNVVEVRRQKGIYYTL